VERPLNPWDLEGFPGAAIERDLFPLRAGTRWVFRDRLDPDGEERVWALDGAEGGLVLTGRGEQAEAVAWVDGFLEIRRGSRLVDRPLRASGRIGHEWRADRARCVALGYDRLEVLGEARRALVVAVERKPRFQRARTRDLYWFAPGLGWARVRTERDGRAVSDLELMRFDAGGSN
jgi:hypothetical protein